MITALAAIKCLGEFADRFLRLACSALPLKFAPTRIVFHASCPGR